MISAVAESLLQAIVEDVDRYLRDDSITDGRAYFLSVYYALQDLEQELLGE
jgi:hypothetical protein